MGDIRVGTSGWSYRTWVGPFYPDPTPAARMLAVYAQTFDAVEAHATHRRLPTAAGLARWVSQSPDRFRFAPKAHAGITHRRDTDGVAERVKRFFAALEPLGDRLGPVLFVLPHRQPDLERLGLLLGALDATTAQGGVFELAPPWRVPSVLDLLTAHRASLAIVDRDDDPGHDQPEVGPLTYVRLRRQQYTGSDLDAWAERLAAAAAQGDVYAFVKHDEEGHGPRYARDLVARLEQR
ncbi:MAG: DUF72 domain-containing protein [Actinomycetota bacterium]|nr:DUF72 domain-containing protein [Actinomycetota bacterium]